MSPPPATPARDEMPANPNRERVLAYITANPGCSRQDIADAVGLNRTAVAHHVALLRRANLAGLQRQGRRVLHFPVAPLPAAPTLLGLLRQDGARRVLAALAEDPGRSVRALARTLGIAPHSVRWHLARFEREGLLQVQAGLVGGRRFELHRQVLQLLRDGDLAGEAPAAAAGGPAAAPPAPAEPLVALR